MAFTLRIQSSGTRKIEAIKNVREILGCGLKDAKDLVDAAPFVLPAPDRDAAEKIAARFRALDLPVDILEDARVIDAAVVPLGDGVPLGGGPFRLVVDAVGVRKIQVIKTVREITQLDLLSAKNLVDQGEFQIERDLDRRAAETALDRLTAAGATARIMSAQGATAGTGPRKPPKPPPTKMGPMPY